MRKPPRNYCGYGMCRCGMSCCTCKTHCDRPYCNKKSQDEITRRNERIQDLTISIERDRNELSGLKREAKR